MSHTRRDFVKASAAFAASSSIGNLSLASGRHTSPKQGTIRHDSWNTEEHRAQRDRDAERLSELALDTATRSGAAYADVRFTVTREETIWVGAAVLYACGVDDSFAHGIGVRVLADGAWGFAASSVWTADEVIRLAREATALAKLNAAGRLVRVELGDPPPAVKGEWTTPGRDPFSVSLEEKYDVGMALVEVPERIDLGAASASSNGCRLRHRRQEKTYASTIGSFVKQTLYLTDHQYLVRVDRGQAGAVCPDDRWQPTAGGWEVANNAAFIDGIPNTVDEALRMTYDQIRPVDPNRYEVVFDAITMGRLVGRTIGLATELDRVLGYEANAGGTSYLAPPEELLNKHALGPSLLGIVANRSRPGGLATVQWDDDGVTPQEYAVIRNGTLANYHTTREFASTLSRFAAPTDVSLSSYGCSGAESALGFPMVHPPNLEMIPQTGRVSFDDLVAELDSGLAIRRGLVTTDRQQLNGEINRAMIYKIDKGKRVYRVDGAGALFRAPEVWKGLRVIGGPDSRVQTGLVDVEKGQPVQRLSFGVTAVPARVSGIVMTDRLQRS